MTIRWAAIGLALLLAPLSASAEAGETSAAVLTASCFSCHGPGGASPGKIPSIAGFSAVALTEKLAAFSDGSVEATVMTRIVKGYDAAELSAIVAYLAADN